MGKYNKKVNCNICGTPIRSDRMSVHVDTHQNGRGKFARKATRSYPDLPGPTRSYPDLPGPTLSSDLPGPSMTYPVLPCPIPTSDEC